MVRIPHLARHPIVIIAAQGVRLVQIGGEVGRASAGV